MIIILQNNVSNGERLTKQEIEAATAIIKFISKYFENIGLGIGAADLHIIKDSNRGYPQFCPQSLNPEISCDRIYLSMDSFDFWCQFIFQAAHEFTHCVIHRLNSHEDRKALWIEEIICEAMSLIFLKTFADNWSSCALSSKSPYYCVNIQDYLNKRLEESGTNELKNCSSIMVLREIECDSCNSREKHREEMHQLYYLIQSDTDIQALVHYRDFIVPRTLFMEAQQYQSAYPLSIPVQYLCSLQENIVKKNAEQSSIINKSK